MIGTLNLVGSIQVQQITREVRDFSATTSGGRITLSPATLYPSAQTATSPNLLT